VIIQFQQGTDFPIALEHEDDIESQGDVMFYDMHQDVIHAHVGIGGFHAIAVFLDQSLGARRKETHDVRIYDRALSEVEIRALSNEGG